MSATRAEGTTLDIVVVLYHSAETLTAMAPTWRAALDRVENVSVVVVDNSPEPEGRAVVERILGADRVVYEHRPENLGFAGGTNRAVDRGRGEWLFFLNPDVALAPDSLQLLLAALTTDLDPPPQVLAVPLLTHGVVSCGISLTWLGPFVDRPRHAARAPVGPSGGATLIRRDTFVDVGGYDESFFAWGEDADLACRLRARGYRTHCVDSLELHHLGGHSVTGQAVRRVKARHLAENRLTVLARHYSTPMLLTVVPGYVLFTLGLVVLHARRGTLRAWWTGTVAGLRGFRARRRERVPRLMLRRDAGLLSFQVARR